MAKSKHCSFCNNEISIDNLGIEGLHACICFDCLSLYHRLVEFHEEDIKQKENDTIKDITPKIIFN